MGYFKIGIVWVIVLILVNLLLKLLSNHGFIKYNYDDPVCKSSDDDANKWVGILGGTMQCMIVSAIMNMLIWPISIPVNLHLFYHEYFK